MLDLSRPAVLVVDDEADIRSFLVLALRHEGFTVYPAGEALEAVQMLELHAGEIQFALVDLRMPVVNGLETIRLLRKISPDLPCCLTGGYLDLSQDVLEQVGACCVLAKPFKPSEVVEKVQAALRRPCGVS